MRDKKEKGGKRRGTNTREEGRYRCGNRNNVQSRKNLKELETCEYGKEMREGRKESKNEITRISTNEDDMGKNYIKKTVRKTKRERITLRRQSKEKIREREKRK